MVISPLTHDVALNDVISCRVFRQYMYIKVIFTETAPIRPLEYRGEVMGLLVVALSVMSPSVMKLSELSPSVMKLFVILTQQLAAPLTNHVLFFRCQLQLHFVVFQLQSTVPLFFLFQGCNCSVSFSCIYRL